MDQEILFKKKWLEWVLNFIEIDLSALSEIQFKRLQREMIEFLEAQEQLFIDHSIAFDLQEIQQEITPLIQFLTGPRDIFNEHFDLPSLQPFLNTVEYPDKTHRIDIGLTFQGAPFKIETATPATPATPAYLHLVTTNIINLVKDIPLESLIGCKECRKWFLNLSARKKVYCGPTCYTHHFYKIRMERIKQNPRKYEAQKKQKALYQKKRYRALKLGKWNPR